MSLRTRAYAFLCEASRASVPRQPRTRGLRAAESDGPSVARNGAWEVPAERVAIHETTQRARHSSDDRHHDRDYADDDEVRNPCDYAEHCGDDQDGASRGTSRAVRKYALELVEGAGRVVAKLCIAMARPAQHRIELSEEERAELVQRARAEKLPFQDVQRARIVLYAAEGMADTEIAARLDTTAGIVGKWRRRFFDDRLEGLRDKPRAGRPRRFPPAAGRRGQGDRVRAAGHPWPAAVEVLAR